MKLGTAARVAGLAGALLLLPMAPLPAAAQDEPSSSQSADHPNYDRDTYANDSQSQDTHDQGQDTHDQNQDTQGEDRPARTGAHAHDEYSEDEIVHAASDFFGTTTETVAKAVERVFSELGEPDAYIKGEEGSGAFIVGVRYGSGFLVRKGFEPVEVYWKGPSVGFDVGGNGSKVFTLVYNLKHEHRIYQRFPGVEGSFYFVAGIGVNYMRSGGVTLAPMRTGLGLRAGVNAHYQVYTKSRDWFPL
jgi:hypothetical protein